MQFRHAFRLSLALAAGFTCAPALAHAARQDGTPPPPPPPLQSSSNPMRASRPFPSAQPPRNDVVERNAQRTMPNAYRLTYTLTEMDGTRRIGAQHYSIALNADSGQTFLRLGSRIPIATEMSASDSSAKSSTQFQYVDVGMDIKAQLRQFANGIQLQSSFTQSAAEAPTSSLKALPVIRQTTLNNTVRLVEGKATTLGSADIPGSTRSLQVQVELTKVD